MYNHRKSILKCVIVGHPEPEKEILLAFLSTFWHPCSKCILMCFKKDRGRCQVWKCPKVPELGQRSNECIFLYIRQILPFYQLAIKIMIQSNAKSLLDNTAMLYKQTASLRLDVCWSFKCKIGIN